MQNPEATTSIYDPRSVEMQRLLATRNKVFMLLSMAFIITLVRGNGIDTKTDIKTILLETFITMWALIGGQFSMSLLLQPTMQQATGTLYPFLPTMLTSKEYREMQKLKQDMLPYYPKICAADRETLHEAFASLETSLIEDSPCNVSKNIVLYLQTALKMFRSVNRRGFQKTEVVALMSRIDKLLATYPTLVQSQLRSFLRPLIAEDILERPYKAKGLFIYGPSGVGKTALVTTLFRDICEFNVLVTTLKDFFTNRPYYSPPYYNFKLEHLESVTLAMISAKESSRKFTVVILDESDKMFSFDENGKFIVDESNVTYMPPFLSMTEPNLTMSLSYALALNTDMTKVIFVMLANRNYLPGSPLERRFVTIEIPTMPQECKENIAHQKGAELLAASNLTLNPEQEDFMQGLINTNQDPGVAKLLDDIKALTTNISSNTVFTGTSWEFSTAAMLTQFTMQHAAENNAIANNDEAALDRPPSPASIAYGLTT